MSGKKQSNEYPRLNADGSVECEPRMVRQVMCQSQKNVFKLLTLGRHSKRIAEDLKLSEKTVQYHRAKLLRKLKAGGIADLTRAAIRIGLISP